MKGFVKFFSGAVLLLLSIAASAAQINSANYDIYIGDLNNDGASDYYFHGKPLTLILHGDIAIPIVITPANFATFSSGSSFNPQLFSLTSIDIAARIANGTLRLAQSNVDFFVWDNGAFDQSFILLRGATSTQSGLLLTSFSSATLPLVSNTYNTTDVPDINNQAIPLSIEDVNGDGRFDIVIGAISTPTGQNAYLSDSSGVPSVGLKRELIPSTSRPFVNGIPAEGNHVGATAAQFRVNESGAATYNIPITVAGGVAGVTPQLSLSYNSQTGNGLLGKGWSLNGLSEISRCRQTVSQDGVAKPITWTAEDRFCLSGQRLMLVSGTYGASGSTYRTEIDSFVTVTAYGGSSGHPDYFKIEAKDGSISTYGDVGQDLSEISGRDTSGNVVANRVMSWSLKRFNDSVGNPIVYIYESTADYHHIKEIRYAYGVDKTDGAHNAKIVFSYVDRNDVSAGYLGGYQFKNTQLLKNIKTYSDTSTQLRSYEVYYQQAATVAGSYNRVSSIQECKDSLNCYRPTKFDWYEPSANIEFGEMIGVLARVGVDSNPIVNYTFMDINANTTVDFVWAERHGSNIKIRYGIDIDNYHNYSNSLYGYPADESVLLTTLQTSNSPKFQSIDYNADGRQDLLIFNPDVDRWYLYLAIPTIDGGWKLSNASIAMPFTNINTLFGDMDSDGLVDAIEVGETSSIKIYNLQLDVTTPVTSNVRYKFPTTGTTYSLGGYSVPIGKTVANDPEKSRLADFNGDGKVDLFLTRDISTAPPRSYVSDYDSNIYVWNDNGFTHLVTIANQKIDDVQTPDVNADGLVDIAIRLDSGGWKVKINTGTDFINSSLGSDIDGAIDKKASLVDINHDGYTDFVWRTEIGNPWLVKYWNQLTQSFAPKQTLISFDPNDDNDQYVKDADIFFMDVNGDSWLERIRILYRPQEFDGRFMLNIASLSNTGGLEPSGVVGGTSIIKPDVITGIANGLGSTISISTQQMNSSKHYLPIGNIRVGDKTINKCQSTATYIGNVFYPGEMVCSDITVTAPLTDEFYQQKNAPFQGLNNPYITSAPVLEVISGLPIVTKVTSFDSNIEYYYKHMRMQAKGRGMLGFASVTSLDLGNNVRTETTYRQDWPYIGIPESTVRIREKIGSRPSFLLSRADNQLDTKVVDLSGKKHFQPFIDKTKEVSFGLKDNGTVQGDLLQTIDSDTDYDDYGNVTSLTVVTTGKSADGITDTTFTTTTVNTYGTTTDYKKKGRLTKSVVTTQRDSETAESRDSEFTYYTSGVMKDLLDTEIIEPSNTDLKVTKKYYYDSFGNKIRSAVTAKINSTTSETRNTHTIYESNGRYIKETKNDLNHSSTVNLRDETGLPKNLTDINGINVEIFYTAMGVEYMSKDATGSWGRTETEYCNSNCSIPARYFTTKRTAGGGRSTEFFDSHGRSIGSEKIGFNGEKILTKTTYDSQGRIKEQTIPFVGISPALADKTKYEYNFLGQVTKITAPDDSVSTSTYEGYSTIITNPLLHTRTETKNGLGQLVRVKDAAGGVVDYTYNFKGDLLTATTKVSAEDAAGITVKICYDVRGQKVAMLDPDKGGFKATVTECSQVTDTTAGWWKYKHNGFGELTKQIDPKGQSSEMYYDKLGRMISRYDRKVGNEFETYTTWQYDTDTDGVGSKGKLTSVMMNTLGGFDCTNGESYCHRTKYEFDSYTRPTTTTLYIPGNATAFVTKAEYDRFGRSYKSYDALDNVIFNNGTPQRSGTRTEYNQYGYAEKVFDVQSGKLLSQIKNTNIRGQVTEELRGNGLASINVYDPLTGLLTNQKTLNSLGLTNVQNNVYKWDSVGNLSYRQNLSGKLNTPTAANSTMVSKNQSESFCYDNLNRLVKSYNFIAEGYCVTAGSSYELARYDAFGNITYKKDVGDYGYGINAGPHAVTSAGGVAYIYDNNGNMTGGDGRTIEYTSYDMASKIIKGINTVEFKYGPNRARWERKDSKNNVVTTTTTYLGNVERIQTSPSTVEWKRNVAGVVHSYKTDASNNLQATDKRYIYNDHLGSLDLITDANGEVEPQFSKVSHSMSFDPWGKRRDGENWSAAGFNFDIGTLIPAGFTQPISKRGFTGHEMLDDFGIIHMNGRIYDPKLGRFLQADPFIQAAANTQSYNRYSYVLNNPLNATDPSGFYFQFIVTAILAYGVTEAVKDIPYVSQLASMVACFYGGVSTCSAVAFGSTYSVTGNLGMSMIAAVSAGAFNGAGPITKFFASGYLGGMSSVMAGGKFGHGFMSAGLSSAIPSGTGWTGFVASAVVGGTISELTGGKFANGATSAAFAYAVKWGAEKINTDDVTNKVAQQWAEYEANNPAPKNETPQQRLERVHSWVKKNGYSQGVADSHKVNINIGGTEAYNAFEVVDVNNISINENFLATVSDKYIAFGLAHEYVHISDMLTLGITKGSEWEGTADHFKSEIKAYKWQNENAGDFGFKSWSVKSENAPIIQCYQRNLNSVTSGSGFTIGC